MKALSLYFALALLLSATLARAQSDQDVDPDAILDALKGFRRQAQTAPERLPVRKIERITAWQQSPLYLVLNDREPGDPDSFPMTHPLFAFERSDGRLLVVDAGLASAEAQAFGGPTEWLGSEPIQCDTDAWRPLLQPGT